MKIFFEDTELALLNIPTSKENMTSYIAPIQRFVETIPLRTIFGKIVELSKSVKNILEKEEFFE